MSVENQSKGRKTVKEISAGGVVYKKEGSAIRIQLIYDRYGKIGLAKGKMEPGETVEQTALREISEETGIVGRIVAPLETIQYQYRHPHAGRIDKEVHFFLVEAVGGDMRAQVEEIMKAIWCEPAEAWVLQRQSGYGNNDSVLQKAFAYLGIEVE